MSMIWKYVSPVDVLEMYNGSDVWPQFFRRRLCNDYAHLPPFLWALWGHLGADLDYHIRRGAAVLIPK